MESRRGRKRRVSRKTRLSKRARLTVQRAGASPPEKPLEQFLNGVFYINLDRRKDRRAHIESVLRKLGLFAMAQRIPGVVHKEISAGCTIAHLNALKLAKQRGWKNTLILEDDFLPEMEPLEFRKRLMTFAQRYGDSYDVAMLAHAINKSEPQDDIVVRIKDAQTSSAYIINERAYDRLIALFEEAIPKLIKSGEHWNWVIDQVWKRIQPDMQWYGFVPRLGRQMPSWSNIENKLIDYGV